MVVPGVSLGSDGMLVGINLLGDLQSGAVVDIYNLYDANSRDPGPLTATFAGMHNDWVYIKLRGGLRQGHLALLARSPLAGLGQVFISVDSPPGIVLSPGGGGGETAFLDCPDCPPPQRTTATSASAAAPLFVTDCEPTVPNTSNWTCIPVVGSTNCGAGVLVGSPECSMIRSRSPRFCKAAGGTLKRTSAVTQKWKLSIHLDGGTAPLASGGGFEYGEDSQSITTDEWTAPPGADGLGKCIRYFRFNLVCAQLITYRMDGMVFTTDGDPPTFNPCSLTTTAGHVCHDLSATENICDRTP
jgi:hypothetical protein